MRISDLTFTNQFLNESQQLQQQQNILQQEVSTGLKVQNPDDNPAVMSHVLNLQTSAAQNQQYQKNIASLQTTASQAGTAMTNLQSILSNASQLASAASSTANPSTDLPKYSAQLQNYIAEAVAIGNTQDSDGNYLFGGTASGGPPFSTTLDSSGNIVGVTYNGNHQVIQSQIGTSMSTSATVPGVNTSGGGAQGLFADSRTGADLFSHLLTLQSDINSGNTSAISSTDMPAMSKDEDNVVNQISANGVTQAALVAAGNIASSQNANITSEVSGLTSADLAQTLTQLDQTQTAYQAALQSGTMVMRMSILDYIQ